MKSFFEHKCTRCGVIDEARFLFAGPHIKQVCNSCGAYVKFFDKSLIPDVKEIKLKIWVISDQNLELIEKAKKEMEFAGACSGLWEKIMYWRLYLKVREHIQKRITI
jgi:hypothetical protein